MELINIKDIKTKYSSHFDMILPWFPIYLQNIKGDNVYILKYVYPNNHEAFYYKVSGEWGFILRYDGTNYFKELNIGARNFVLTDFIPSSPEEFLKNNPCCKQKSTCEMCIEVWNDIVADNNLAKEQIWEFINDTYYYHDEYYYDNKYKNYEL